MVESAKAESKKGPQKIEHLKIHSDGFIHENTGNIKDFYKISSCIGRGNFQIFPFISL